jgi:hypothetical protein
MWDFFKSDVGKVALGGLIAVGGQLAVTLIAWGKEVWFDRSKKRKEAEYLAMRLVLVFDELTNDCYNTVHDPLMADREGCSESTVADPTLTLPSNGDYKALPRHLMFEIMSMPNRLDSIMEGLSSAWDFSGPPDFTEFFEYRREHWSKLGLKSLDLIDALCRQYKIPVPERPEYYSPRQSFENELAEIIEDQKKRSEENDRMVALMKKSSAFTAQH